MFQIHSTAWYSWVECCSVSLYIKIWRSVGYCANQCPVSWRTVKVSERHSEKQSMYSWCQTMSVDFSLNIVVSDTIFTSRSRKTILKRFVKHLTRLNRQKHCFNITIHLSIYSLSDTKAVIWTSWMITLL